ncbi:chemotaxis protein CheW [Sulfurospirillum diekertiae]|uniref:CheW-like domain-containing protein n=1 Tax=Sulfurospirillum diekertiae TaxID=1854492 RepID=A0A1Y0HK12_9BACT|nr:chemotaxis protein CheW [Sulfurospirillum diekertiae]ARU48459.1 hypothetical protein Sdiek1_1295 [Sulfurospirillum diekertiae]ASC93293.1 hypothetical protein Sdiek2_1274 [Sulfurospirillum diekertiae]
MSEQSRTSRYNAYIPEVVAYQKALDQLSERWNLLSLLGQMSNIGMDISETRQAFSNLSEQLLQRLSEETVKKLATELGAKAQVAIDILIRNLFERTADIGFLAMDTIICDFARMNHEEQKVSLPSLQNRFLEYIEKYSVYNDVLLFSLDGTLIASTKDEKIGKKIEGSLIYEAIHTSKEYVESFGVFPLVSEKESLLYSYRVCDENGTPLAVLCLVFKFQDEMRVIISNLIENETWADILILDENNGTIYSSDPFHYALRAPQKTALKNFDIIPFAGSEYVAKTQSTKGYQGFYGLGWMGHALMPLFFAFNQKQEHVPFTEGQIKIIKNSSLFSEEFTSIPTKAEAIQRRLDMTIWNGNVQIANQKSGDNSFSKSLLNEISRTGAQTKKTFEESIGNLNWTVVASFINNAAFNAKLAIDIMDRNLYERANDCRWWALSPVFIKAFSAKYKECTTIRKEFGHEITEVLGAINSLYTVYSNLFLFDAQGCVIAVSQEKYAHLIGKRIGAHYIAQTLALKSSKEYVVSPFEKTELYDGKYTYIYSAPIFIEGTKEAQGGIGIVFDAEVQFEAMLRDVVGEDERSFALFLESKTNSVIASTNPAISIGERCVFCDSSDSMVLIKNEYYIIGKGKSQGYREFKCSDGYCNDVTAIVCIKIANQDACVEDVSKHTKKQYLYPKIGASEKTIELSTFWMNGNLFAIESQQIYAALEGQDVTQVIGCDEIYVGMITWNNKTIPVASLAKYFHHNIAYNKELHHIIVLKGSEEKPFGLVIDMVQDSPEVPVRCIDETSQAMMGQQTLTKAIVKADVGQEKAEMLSLLDPLKIEKYLLMDKTISNSEMRVN